jgi:hypothetical protein
MLRDARGAMDSMWNGLDLAHGEGQ